MNVIRGEDTEKVYAQIHSRVPSKNYPRMTFHEVLLMKKATCINNERDGEVVLCHDRE